jgi:hypothetical protein
MEHPTIYFDESGNTGPDLFNIHQPWFVLASLKMEDDHARDIIARLMVKNYAEIKFSSLRKSVDGRKALLELYRGLVPDCVKAVAYHKRFMITTEIVDLLVETLAHRTNFDLYVQGANLALSNFWYTVLPVFCGRKLFEEMQIAFVEMVRRRTAGRVHAFYSLVQDLYDACANEELRESLGMLAATRLIITEVLPVLDDSAIDPAVPSFTHLCDRWGRSLGGLFSAVHDDSLTMEQQKSLLELLMDREEPEVEIGYDRRKTIFPLRATQLDFAASHTVPQLQVADVLASGIGFWQRNRTVKKHEAFATEIGDSVLGEIDLGLIAPSASVTPEDLGTADLDGMNPVNYTAAFLARKRAKRG